MIALEEGESCELDDVKEDEKEIIDQLTDDQLKLAFMIGCTFNISGYRELDQKYYLCETCENIEKEEVVICYPCAKFCHKGHKMTRGSKGKRKKIVCSCGSNIFDIAPRNDKENPLIQIKGEDELPQNY
jgi:hypothetical protein